MRVANKENYTLLRLFSNENRAENNFMPALSPSSDNSNSESKKISFQNEPNVINADVAHLDLHEVVEIDQPRSHVEKPNSQLSVRINSSLVNENSCFFFGSLFAQFCKFPYSI